MINIKTIQFMRLRKVSYVLAILVFLGSIASLAVKQLNLGLDFTGGALVELNYSDTADLDAVRDLLHSAGWEDATVQNFGASTDVLIRLASDDAELGNKIAQLVKREDGGEVSVKRVEFIGPQVGEELRDQGGLGMLMALAEWDMAAGSLLIQEAGGLVSDFTGGHHFLEKGHIVTGSPKCFKAVLTAIQPHLTPAMKR